MTQPLALTQPSMDLGPFVPFVMPPAHHGQSAVEREGGRRHNERLHESDRRFRELLDASLSMALHELCTNAAKYRALSNETRQAGVQWSLTGANGGARLRLRWEEAGGPPVAAPRRKGVGTRLITNGAAHALTPSCGWRSRQPASYATSMHLWREIAWMQAADRLR